MSYKTTADAAHDGDLQQRFIACAAGESIANAPNWVMDNIWYLVASPDVANAYDYATGQGLANIGARDDVVNDNVILAVVQARVAALATP